MDTFPLNYSQPRGISLLVPYKASEMRKSDLKHHDKDAGDLIASYSKTHYWMQLPCNLSLPCEFGYSQPRHISIIVSYITNVVFASRTQFIVFPSQILTVVILNLWLPITIMLCYISLTNVSNTALLVKIAFCIHLIDK